MLTADDLDHFRDRGYVYVRGAFGRDEAAAMRDVTWAALERTGIRRDDPATWTVEAPSHLQRLKRSPVFRAVGSARTRGAIDDLLGPGCWQSPRDWGAFFVLFPTPRPWTVPHKAWHADHDYALPLEPLRELKVQALYGDVEPRAGGMTVVAGSHLAVAAHPLPPGTPPATARKAVIGSHPYLAELSQPGGAAERIARFVDRDEQVGDARLRVVELAGSAGDVVLLHPLLLHTRPANSGAAPRFLLNRDLYQRTDHGPAAA